MANAGEFEKTVQLQRQGSTDADSLGHSGKVYTAVRKCAARIWTRGATETTTGPAEFGAGALRLLLRLPPRDLAIGWRLIYESNTYSVVDIDYRDDDMLVTLDRV